MRGRRRAVFPTAVAAGGWYAAAATAAVIGGIAGGLSSALAGGSLSDVLRGALIGGISGAITGGVLHGMEGAAELSGQFLDKAMHVAGHGIVGGATNVAMGGKFGDGFLSAAAAAYVGWTFMKNSVIASTIGSTGPGRTIIAGIVGGTVSAIGGGKFANGAYTAAFQHLLNHEYSWGGQGGAYMTGSEGVLDLGKDLGKDFTAFLHNTATSVGLVTKFLTGAGDKYVEYDGGNFADSFRNADVVNQGRNYWYAEVQAGRKSVYDGLENFGGKRDSLRGNFGAPGVLKAGLSPGKQVVGSFRLDATSNGKQLTFILTNRMSMDSLTNGLIGNYGSSNPIWTPGSTIYQRIKFRENIR